MDTWETRAEHELCGPRRYDHPETRLGRFSVAVGAYLIVLGPLTFVSMYLYQAMVSS